MYQEIISSILLLCIFQVHAYSIADRREDEANKAWLLLSDYLSRDSHVDEDVYRAGMEYLNKNLLNDSEEERSKYGTLETDANADTKVDQNVMTSDDELSDDQLFDRFDRASISRDAADDNVNGISDDEEEISDEEYEALVDSVRDAVESLLMKREAQRRELGLVAREFDVNHRESFNPLRRLIEFIKKYMPKALKKKPENAGVVGVVKRCYGDKRSCVGLEDAMDDEMWQEVSDEEMDELMS